MRRGTWSSWSVVSDGDAEFVHESLGKVRPLAGVDADLGQVGDASEIGRPHAWQELHRVAGILMRRRAPEGRPLFDALAALD